MLASAPAVWSDCKRYCSGSPSFCNLPISRDSRGVRSVAPCLWFANKHPQLEFVHRTPVRLVVKCAAIHESLPCTDGNASLYAILGLEQADVSHADIKSAYRQMARRYHPDVCVASEKQESIHKFLQVQEAYEILSDPERRADYDYGLLHPFSAQTLGKGFVSNMEMKGRTKHRSREAGHGVSVAWQLQWEAQLSRLKLRRQECKSSSTGHHESWGAKMRAKMRRENCSASEICVE